MVPPLGATMGVNVGTLMGHGRHHGHRAEAIRLITMIAGHPSISSTELNPV
jgi:hypothetical protein